RLPARGIGKPDHGVTGQPARDVHLDGDDPAVDSFQNGTANGCEHDPLPRFGRAGRRGCDRRAVTVAFDGDADHTPGVRQPRTTLLRMSAAPRRAASHDPDGFVTALSAMSTNTRRAYEHDAREFVEWCERGGCTDASALDHRVLRRYLAYLQTRGFSRPSI